MLPRGREGSTHEQRLNELPKEHAVLEVTLAEGLGAQGGGMLHRKEVPKEPLSQ